MLQVKEVKMFGLYYYQVVLPSGQVLCSHMSKEGAFGYIQRVNNTILKGKLV